VILKKESLLKAVFASLAGATLVMTLTGCVISPRRTVVTVGTPTPTETPTPTGTPTPGTTPTPTPTPSPTPTPVGGAGTMSAKVNSVVEFLFVANENEKSNSLQGFRINGDGALAAVTGSPFLIGDTPHKLLASGDSLIMAGSAAIIVFQVDKVSGALRQTDSVSAISPQVVIDAVNNLVYSTSNGETMTYRLANGMLRTIGSSPEVAQPKNTMAMSSSATTMASSGTMSSSGGAVIDATGSFAYALNSTTGQIDAFRVSSDKRLTPLDPSGYPAGQGATSLAIVAP
jgi:hypothetical protein